MISPAESVAIIAVCAACTFLERALPFAIFRKGEVPGVIRYLGKVLPMAIMMTLVIYCIRGISFSSPGKFVPEMIGCTVTAVLHLWKRNAFLSILGGTAVYMILIQMVF